MAESTGQQLATALDPRRKLYRNRFNEYFVFLASASGAVIQVPVVMLVLSLIIGRLELLPFVGLSVAIEWFIIFALARPQMKPVERVGWALLWGATTAFFAVCFYLLVVENVVA
jgi:hypothetical protein